MKRVLLVGGYLLGPSGGKFIAYGYESLGILFIVVGLCIVIATYQELKKEEEKAAINDIEVGWIIENGKDGDELRYRTILNGVPTWTAFSVVALRFARRVDAERFAEEDEDAWRIVEHAWHRPTGEA